MKLRRILLLLAPAASAPAPGGGPNLFRSEPLVIPAYQLR